MDRRELIVWDGAKEPRGNVIVAPRHRSTMERLTPRLGEPDPARRKEQRSGGLAPRSCRSSGCGPRFVETQQLPLRGTQTLQQRGVNWVRRADAAHPE